VGKELVPVPQEDVFSNLQAIKKEKYEAALSNLVTGKTPRDVVFQRPIRGGANVDYVPGWWFIEQLNSLFGHLWDYKILRENIGQQQVWVLGELTVKSPDGTTVTKSAFGGSDIKKYSDRSDKSGQIIDIADDLKAAATDSLKKAATLLGLASDIYGKREVLEHTSTTSSQLKSLYKIAESKSMTREQVDALSIKEFGEPPDKLEAIKVLGLIQKVRSR